MKIILIFVSLFIFSFLNPAYACGDAQSPEVYAACPLHYLVVQNDIKSVREYINSGKDINAKCYGVTALTAALDNSDMLKLLIRNGADINSSNEEGRTALMIMAELGGKIENAELLIFAGADLEKVDRHGMTALMLTNVYDDKDYKGAWRSMCPVKKNGQYEIAALLLKNGAKVNSADKYGMTPLMMAAGGAHKDIVNLLISYGAKVNYADAVGYTALHSAATSGNAEIVKILLGNGADASVETKEGKTAYSLAVNDEVRAVFKKYSLSKLKARK